MQADWATGKEARMKLLKSLVVVGVVLGGAAFAETPREELMKSFGGAAKTLGQMASGEVAYDQAAAEAARTALAEGAGKISATFEAPPAEGEETESKPEIWTNWDDFVVKANALKAAAEGMDVASAEGIGAGMGAIGGTCKDCHTLYRAQN
jgi:cytochrome c556